MGRMDKNMPGASFSLLVVDDEEAMRRSLAEILKLEGYQVQTAPDGETAIAKIKSTDYDLLLLDLKMPGIDGIQVLRFAAQTRPDTQVILLTAHGSLESAIEALRHGANDYLLKPASTEQILNGVQKALLRRAARQQRSSLLGQIEASVTALLDTETNGLGQAKDGQGRAEAAVQPGYAPKGGPDSPAAYKRATSQRTLDLGNGILLDLFRRELVRAGKEGGRVSLTPNEGKLLEALAETPGRVFSHQELVEKIHGFKATTLEAAEMLRPLISRLRRKFHVFGGENWIVSIRSAGYVLNQPGSGPGDILR